MSFILEYSKSTEAAFAIGHYAAIWNPRINRFYQRKKAKAHILVAKKAVANKLARACYHMLKRREEFDVTRASPKGAYSWFS